MEYNFELDLTQPGITDLVAKLCAACDEVGGVEKKGKNQDQNYSYMKAADIAKAFRHELFSRGILIIPHEIAHEEFRFETYAGKKAVEDKVTTVFIITDGKAKICVQSIGKARDTSDKGIWKAKTGAIKYLLRGLGIVPDEKEDPETTHIEEGDHEADNLARLEPKMKKQQLLNKDGVTKFLNTATRNNHTMEEIDEYLQKTFGHHLASELTVGDLPEAMKWATTQPEDLVAKATEALQDIKRRKYSSEEMQ